ncbi:hypothetical protein V7S43_009911 [Phytophthora oleae]|uniref:RxLR effector protein n=1 Tax=Phytophthora oleae TaxID=2107226 RepID=A0ABD3FEA0_9STRA
MNDVIRILLLLSLVSLEAAELLETQRTNSIQPLLQGDEDEFDPATTAFLAQVSSATLENDTAEDFTTFIDALAANTSENQSSGGNTFEDGDSDFSSALSSASDEENASISLDQDVGSSFSSNGEVENEIDSDANLAGGKNLPSSLATMQHPSGFIVLLTIALIIEMIHWLHQDAVTGQ